MYIYIHIYVYGNPPQELPTLVLYRKCGVKPDFPGGQDSVSYTRSLNVGGLLAVSRHLAVLFFGGTYVHIYIRIYVYHYTLLLRALGIQGGFYGYLEVHGTQTLSYSYDETFAKL